MSIRRHTHTHTMVPVHTHITRTRVHRAQRDGLTPELKYGRHLGREGERFQKHIRTHTRGLRVTTSHLSWGPFPRAEAPRGEGWPVDDAATEKSQLPTLQ